MFSGPIITNLSEARYTETERSQHILHSDTTIFGQSYVAFVSSCDGFAAFMREKPDHTAVEYFQGISQFWQPGLPTKLPAALRAEVKGSQEIAEYDRKIREAVDNGVKDRATKDRQNAFKRLKKRALDLHRTERMKELRRERLIHGMPSTPSDDPDPLDELIPEKGRITKAMLSDSPLSEELESSIMQDMLSLSTNPWSVFYRPGEVPLDGACPYCRTNMEE